MAQGDTITGEIRVVRVEPNGNETVVIGSLSSKEVDHFTEPDKALYVNPTKITPAPPRNPVKNFKDAVFYGNEVIKIQHQSADLEEDIDVSKDKFDIPVIEVDKKRGQRTPKTLSVKSNDVTSNPSSSKDEWVTIYKYTVPSEVIYLISGMLNIAAVENS